MNVLFLIGNGFDLNVGLNTRFRDALESYLKEKTTDPKIIKFKDDIKQDFENWSDFEKQIGIYTSECTHSIDDFCFCVKDFKVSLVEHLKKEEKRIDYNLHKDSIVNIFKSSISGFYNGLNDSSKNLLRERIPNNNLQYNFITFNYTTVLDECLNILNKYPSCPNINQILHIHGGISRHPLLGVDNPEQIANKEFADNEKIGWNIIKPNINNQLKNSNNQTAQRLINNSDIICMFGLSMGETDKKWWNIIGNWLTTEKNHLVIFSVVKPWNLIHADEEIENINQIEKRLCTAAGISNAGRNNVANRIHIGLNTDMFKIDLT